MAATIHRKDMRAADFNLLARFSTLIQRYDHYSMSLNFGLIYSLGLVNMLLPVWYRTANRWGLDRYKEFTQEAIGIEAKTLRGMCRYLDIKECVLVDTLNRLNRFSMLSVVPDLKNYERPKFRMPFVGDVLGLEGLVEPDRGIGFVIEKRRAIGGFRGKAA